MIAASLADRITPGNVLVYFSEVRSPSPALIERLTTQLSSDEQSRVAEFAFEKDRSVFVAAHALLRYALGLIFEADKIRFRVDTYGKPVLDLPIDHDVHFNLSHTRGMAVCAICRGCHVGVDVEEINHNVDMETLAREYFAAVEHQLVVTTPPENRAETFFRLWTLKEATVKAIGTGLWSRLADFAFTLEPLSLIVPPQLTEAAADWQFWEHAPTAIHRVALAVRQEHGLTINVASQLVPLAQLVAPAAFTLAPRQLR
jgi:4'-phosphopantetheinyl transferase